MARNLCDIRILLFLAAAAFIYIQVRLFATQSELADRLASAVESEHRCASEMRLLIDQLSTQQGKIFSLEEAYKVKEEECANLKNLVHDLEKRVLQGVVGDIESHVAAVVIMACNRPDYLERTIQSILKYHSPFASKFVLFISQDGANQGVKSKALTYRQITYMQHLDFEPVHTERPGELIAYYKIASHYKWALDELFFKHNFSRVVILEDDMEIAPDFFSYFEAAATLLDNDRTIMAVSSWNDNGQVQFVHDPKALYRSDFFPGLGWMLTKSMWSELSPKWPKAYPFITSHFLYCWVLSSILFSLTCNTYWDDWIRLKDVHKNRQFVRPEVCRTYNFGEHGSSMGQFFRQYLKPIKLNNAHVDWKSEDLSYLKEDKFIQHFAKMVSDARIVNGPNAIAKASNINGDVRIQYADQSDFEYLARQFGIFEEWKDGVPRTAYKGVVVFRYQTQRRVFLVGPDSLRQLGILT